MIILLRYLFCILFVHKAVLAQLNNAGVNDNKTTNPQSKIQTLSHNESLSYSKLPSSSSCGRINTSPSFRIVGGHPAELGDWPWIVAIGYTNINTPNNPPQWLCGGTLISDRFVVTTAVCTVGTGQKKISVVRLGELDLNSEINDGASPIDVSVEKVLTHEDYNNQTFANDIAILKLNKTISFNNLIQPICLPIKSHIRTNQFLNYIPKIAGWGVTSFRGSRSTMLMEAPVHVFDNAECHRIYSDKKIVVDERILCAGDKNGKTDSCQGDSGGPMVVEIEEQHYLIGAVSFGIKCADPNFPGVYSRITYFIDWIIEKINNS